MEVKTKEPQTQVRPVAPAAAGLAAAAAELAILAMPGADWSPYGDDKCDCLVPAVYQATNPSTGWTHMVRLCCVAATLGQLFPEVAQFMTVLPAWYEVNRNRYVSKPMQWDNREMDMPPSLWFRRMAQETGRPLEEIRAEYQDRVGERPRKLAEGQTTGYAQPTAADLARAEYERLTATGWLIKE